MGNTDSRKVFKQGAVTVTLDNTTNHFMAGDTVTGTVTYKLLEAYPGENLTVHLIGKEKVIYEGHDKAHSDPKHSGKIVMKKKLVE